MRLRIEDGILLKEWVLPWRPTGWDRVPRGWTPDDTNDWVKARAEEILKERLAEMEYSDLAAGEATRDKLRLFALRRAASEYGDVLKQERKPWPGWLRIDYLTDRDISKAYRWLFVEMNVDVPEAEARYRSERVQWPADGFYEFKNGEIRPEHHGAEQEQ